MGGVSVVLCISSSISVSYIILLKKLNSLVFILHQQMNAKRRRRRWTVRPFLSVRKDNNLQYCASPSEHQVIWIDRLKMVDRFFQDEIDDRFFGMFNVM